MIAHESAITSLKALTIKATQVDKGVGVREAVEGMEAGWKQSDQLRGCYGAQSPSWDGWRPAGGSAGGVGSAGGGSGFSYDHKVCNHRSCLISGTLRHPERKPSLQQSVPAPSASPSPGNPRSASVSRALPVLDVFYEQNHSRRAFVSDFIHLV